MSSKYSWDSKNDVVLPTSMANNMENSYDFQELPKNVCDKLDDHHPSAGILGTLINIAFDLLGGSHNH